jgi:hypothetical protein
VIVVLPFTALGSTLGFVALPASLLAIICGLIALYIAVNEAMKNRWWN